MITGILPPTNIKIFKSTPFAGLGSDNSEIISWSAPTGTNNASITGYEVQLKTLLSNGAINYSQYRTTGVTGVVIPNFGSYEYVSDSLNFISPPNKIISQDVLVKSLNVDGCIYSQTVRCNPSDFTVLQVNYSRDPKINFTFSNPFPDAYAKSSIGGSVWRRMYLDNKLIAGNSTSYPSAIDYSTILAPSQSYGGYVDLGPPAGLSDHMNTTLGANCIKYYEPIVTGIPANITGFDYSFFTSGVFTSCNKINYATTYIVDITGLNINTGYKFFYPTNTGVISLSDIKTGQIYYGYMYAYNPSGFSSEPYPITIDLTAFDVSRIYGVLYGWGDNTYNQLGFGTRSPQSDSMGTYYSGLSGVKKIAAGPTHAVAILEDDTVVGWGNNDYGQLPNVEIKAIDVAVNRYATFVLNDSGALTVFGSDYFKLSELPQIKKDVIKMAVGFDFGLALKYDGSVLGWGTSLYNQVNDITKLGGAIDIAAGNNHGLVLLSNLKVTGYGDNTYKQISIPTGMGDIMKIACGPSYSLAINKSGKLYSWGHYADENLSTTGYSVTGVLDGVFSDVSAGYYHNLAIKGNRIPTKKRIPFSNYGKEYMGAIEIYSLSRVYYDIYLNGIRIGSQEERTDRPALVFPIGGGTDDAPPYWVATGDILVPGLSNRYSGYYPQYFSPSILRRGNYNQVSLVPNIYNNNNYVANGYIVTSAWHEINKIQARDTIYTKRLIRDTTYKTKHFSDHSNSTLSFLYYLP